MTLRSLSATDLPDDQRLTVFDDASNDPLTRDYLYTTRKVDLRRLWPTNRHWRDNGLQRINSRVGHGLDGTVPVLRLSESPLGVVLGGVTALRLLLAKCPDGPVVLLQDDVVFRQDWLTRIEVAAACIAEGDPPPGLIAGCDINRELSGSCPMFLAAHGGLTAQCVYLTRAGLHAIRPWLEHPPTVRKGFDNHLCRAVRSAGLGVYLMNPGVCQHFGVDSAVRPHWPWHIWGPQGRIDNTAKGPFVLAPTVRSFRSL